MSILHDRKMSGRLFWYPAAEFNNRTTGRACETASTGLPQVHNGCPGPKSNITCKTPWKLHDPSRPYVLRMQIPLSLFWSKLCWAPELQIHVWAVLGYNLGISSPKDPIQEEFSHTCDSGYRKKKTIIFFSFSCFLFVCFKKSNVSLQKQVHLLLGVRGKPLSCSH